MTETIAIPLPPLVLLDVFVPGRPAPQGSKHGRAIYTGRGADRKFTGKIAQVESSKTVGLWRGDIREVVAKLHGNRPAVTCAVMVMLAFVMPRPASTPKRRTPAAVKRPDLDKLIRGVLDAITSAGVWVDDSQVVDLHATKRIAGIGEPAGCHITIQEAT